MPVEGVNYCNAETAGNVIHYTPRIVCAAAIVIALIALLTIGGNALTKVCQNGGDLKQGIVNGLWSTAKWTGITAGAALGTSFAIDILHGLGHGARNCSVAEGGSKMKEEMAKTLTWGIAGPLAVLALLGEGHHNRWL